MKFAECSSTRRKAAFGTLFGLLAAAMMLAGCPAPLAGPAFTGNNHAGLVAAKVAEPDRTIAQVRSSLPEGREVEVRVASGSVVNVAAPEGAASVADAMPYAKAGK